MTGLPPAGDATCPPARACQREPAFIPGGDSRSRSGWKQQHRHRWPGYRNRASPGIMMSRYRVSPRRECGDAGQPGNPSSLPHCGVGKICSGQAPGSIAGSGNRVSAAPAASRRFLRGQRLLGMWGGDARLVAGRRGARAEHPGRRRRVDHRARVTSCRPESTPETTQVARRLSSSRLKSLPLSADHRRQRHY